MAKKGTLTDKQKRFIDEYLVDLNATQAAIRAGYSPKTARAVGSENLTKPVIVDEIKARLDGITQKTAYDAEAWRNDLILLKKRFMQERPIVDAEGNPFIDENGDPIVTTAEPSGALKALELLGKHMGLFIEKKQVDINITDRSTWLNEVLKDVKDE